MSWLTIITDMVLSKTSRKLCSEGGCYPRLFASLCPSVDTSSTLIVFISRIWRPPLSTFCASFTTVSSSTAGLFPPVIGVLPGPTGNDRGNDLLRPMWSSRRWTVGVRYLVEWRTNDSDDRWQSSICLGVWAMRSCCNNVFLLRSKWVKDLLKTKMVELFHNTWN